MTGRFDGKVAFITGAASGIGAATAGLFARDGAKVVATDIDPASGEALAARLGAAFVRHDVADEASWVAAIEAAQRQHGAIDVLVNNAGVLPAMLKLEETPLAEWRRVMAVNLDGTFLGVKHGIVAMKARGGVIVNVSSVAGLVGMPITGGYSASKAGVHLLTKCAALECAHLGYKIRVNSVHPGYIRTSMTEEIAQTLGEDRFSRHLGATVPLRRMGDPADIAEAIAFLASDQSKFATGTALVIDGGWTAR